MTLEGRVEKLENASGVKGVTRIHVHYDLGDPRALPCRACLEFGEPKDGDEVIIIRYVLAKKPTGGLTKLCSMD